MNAQSLTGYKNPLLQSILFSVLLVPGLQANAQTGTLLEEIVVTAQKREQSLQDVGVSVSAFTGDQIRELGYSKGPDIAAQIPGVQFREGPLSHLTYVNIRGVSQNDFTGHIEVPVATYVDQAYMSLQAASSFQMFDLERVEVVRGPQGTLFGRNATGGLVQYLTRQPTDEFEAYAQLRGGQYEMVRLEGAVSGPLSDTLKGRLSALVNYYDDFQDNRAGEDLNGREDYAVRGQLLFEPNADLSVRLIGTYGESDHTHAFQHSSTGFDPVTGLEFSLPDDVNFYGNCAGCDPSGYKDDDGDPFESNQADPGLFKPESLNLTGIITWDVGGMTVTSVTNYLDYEFFYQEDSELSPRFGLTGNRTQDLDQVTQELRVEGQTDRTRWIGGFYLFDRKSTNGADQPFGMDWFDDLLAGLGATPPGFVRGLGDVNRLVSDFTLDTFSWAVFGQAEYDITPKWTAVAGLRWTEDEKDYEFTSTEFIDGVAVGSVLLGETTFTKATVGDLTKLDKGEWSGHFALHFRPVDDWLLFAGYSRANKGGTFSAPFTGGTVTPVTQEILETYEGGVKASMFDGRVRLNASGYYSDYTDYQGFIFLNLATSFRNIDAEVAGFEVEVFALPREDLEFGLGIGYLDTEADTRVPTADGGTKSTDLPLAPKWSVNGLARKTWPAFGGTVALQADFVYTDDHFSDVLNTPSGHVDSNIIGNASLGYMSGDERWSLSLHVRNIGDDETAIYRIPTHIGFNQDMYGFPRWVFGEFTYNWR